MHVVKGILSSVGSILSYSMNWCGYNISFMQILAFGIIASICGIFIRNLFY